MNNNYKYVKKIGILNIFILIIMLISIIILSSCRETPNAEIITQKIVNDFNDALLVKAESSSWLDCPECYQDSFTSKDNKVVIKINAQILTPKVESLPVIKITPSPISNDLVEWAIGALMEGKEGYYPSRSMTKSEIENIIIEFESYLSNKDEIYETSQSKEEADNIIVSLQSEISRYTQMYISAPEKIPQLPTGLKFRPFQFYISDDYSIVENEINMSNKDLTYREQSNEKNLYLVCDDKLSDGRYARLAAYNEYPISINDFSTESVFYMEKHLLQVLFSYIPFTIDQQFILDSEPFSYYMKFGSLDSAYPDLSIDKDTAIASSIKFLNDLGIENYYVESIRVVYAMKNFDDYRKYRQQGVETHMNMTKYFDSIDANRKFYMVTFKPKYYGVPLLEANQAFYSDDLYRSPVEYEEIVIRVAEDSIAEFRWNTPTDIENVINDNVKIITFKEAMENAKKFIEVKFILETLLPISSETDDYDELIKLYTSGEININEIKLGLAGILANDSVDEYLLIPVWNFYGSYSVLSSEQNLSIGGTQLRLPIITINAIDGSIVQQKATVTY